MAGIKYETIIPCLLIVFLTIALYYRVVHYGFIHYDDDIYLTENLKVQAGVTYDNIVWAFSTLHANFWHPLTWISHMIDFSIFGLSPGFHHLSNLFFHILNTVFLYVVLVAMTTKVWQSAFVASLFAIHPLHTESVVWLSERKDLLSSFFLLLSLSAYHKYTKMQSLKHYVTVFIWYLSGLMAKSMIVTLPILLLLIDYWPLGRFENCDKKTITRLFVEKIPFFLLSLIFGILSFVAQKSGGSLTEFGAIPPVQRIYNAINAYFFYIEKMFLPFDLAILYPHPLDSLNLGVIVLPLFFLAFVTVISLIGAAKHPWFFVGWFWYAITLLPVIGIIQVGPHGMADRYSYISLIGLFIMLGWSIPELLQTVRYKKAFITSITVFFILYCSANTSKQIHYWRDSITLFEHTLKVTKDNYLIHNNLGGVYAEMNLTDKAIHHFQSSLKIKYNYSDAHYNLGLVLNDAGVIDSSAHHYREAIKFDPADAKSYNGLGVALAKSGNLKEAINNFTEALKIDSAFEGAKHNLTRALEERKNNKSK